jgi:hypothetical protein
MTLRICLGCSAKYAPGAHACPQCGSHAGESVEEGETTPAPVAVGDPAKPTRGHTGATQAKPARRGKPNPT